MVWQLVAAAVVGGLTARHSARLSRDAARKERDNHFVNLRESARRGGFNPLTALRATGGGGYGQYVPLLSRSPAGEGISAAGNILSTGIRDQFFAQQNMEHETRMNNAQIAGADARAKRAAANAVKSAAFDYSAVERVAVKFGGKTIQLASDVARRFDLLPGDNLLPGELSEIGGEFWGELVSALGTEAAAEVLGVETWELLGKDKDPNQQSWLGKGSEWYNNVQAAITRATDRPYQNKPHPRNTIRVR